MRHFETEVKESTQKWIAKIRKHMRTESVVLDQCVFKPVDGMEENYTGIPGSAGRPAKNENSL